MEHLLVENLQSLRDVFGAPSPTTRFIRTIIDFSSQQFVTRTISAWNSGVPAVLQRRIALDTPRSVADDSSQ